MRRSILLLFVFVVYGNLNAKRYRLYFTKEFYNILNIHATIWYSSGFPTYETGLLFDPINLLVLGSSGRFTESEMEYFTFCCLLSRSRCLTFGEKQIPKLVENLNKFLEGILYKNRDYYEEISYYFYPLKPCHNPNWLLAEVIVKYFSAYGRNLVDKIGTFVEECKFNL